MPDRGSAGRPGDVLCFTDLLPYLCEAFEKQNCATVGGKY